MNYKKIYEDLVFKAKSENRKKLKRDNELYVYYEKHHTIPKCLGGDNSKENLVLFTAKEHFVAHKLLAAIYPDNKSLFYAFWMMCNKVTSNGNRIYIVSSREYFVVRAKFIESNSGPNSNFYGKIPWNSGIPCSEEIKNKIRVKLKGTTRDIESVNQQAETNKLKYPNGENYKYWKDKKMPKEDVERRRESNKGQKRSEEFIDNLSAQRSGEGNPMYGKPAWNSGIQWPDDVISKFKKSWASREKVECPYCGKVGHQNGMTRYHFENCKFKNQTN